MELANKLTNLAIKAINSNAVVNTCLIASFAALTLRSVKQQNDIEALETEKESLVKANKDLKKRMWDWKQQLYAEATTESALVPLARLKAIYGDAPTPPSPAAGEAMKEDAKSSTTKLDSNSSSQRSVTMASSISLWKFNTPPCFNRKSDGEIESLLRKYSSLGSLCGLWRKLGHWMDAFLNL